MFLTHENNIHELIASIIPFNICFDLRVKKLFVGFSLQKAKPGCLKGQ